MELANYFPIWNKLTPAQQALVTNFDVLQAAMDAYNAAVDKEAAARAGSMTG